MTFGYFFRVQVIADLKRANVPGLRFYRRNEIPEQYHIKDNDRTAPILLVADRKYFLRGFSKNGKTKPVWDVVYTGHHGYDPYNTKEMRTIMYARGPGLRKGFTSKPLIMTDHYNLICHLIDIEARPNNGSWSRVKQMLSSDLDYVATSRNRRNCSLSNVYNFNLIFLLIGAVIAMYTF